MAGTNAEMESGRRGERVRSRHIVGCGLATRRAHRGAMARNARSVRGTMRLHRRAASRRGSGARPRDSHEQEALRPAPLWKCFAGDKRKPIVGREADTTGILWGDKDRLERIEMFIRESGYWDAVAGLGDLSHYCEAQYRTIDALCRVNRKYLEELLPRSIDEEATPFHAAQDDPMLEDKPLRLPIGGSSSGDRQRREGLQEILRDLMRALLEDFPEALDGETINLLATSKNPLGLKIGNRTLIRRTRDGRHISGHSRYWAQPYGGRYYVSSEWSKKDHRHNARRLAAVGRLTGQRHGRCSGQGLLTGHPRPPCSSWAVIRGDDMSRNRLVNPKPRPPQAGFRSTSWRAMMMRWSSLVPSPMASSGASR